jgi:excisionase family DNA binding protein
VITFRAELSDDVVEAIAHRAAELVLERLAGERNGRESEFLTVLEAAELLRSSRQRVYDLLSEGRLTRHKDGSRVLVSRRELVAHVRPTERRSRMASEVPR